MSHWGNRGWGLLPYSRITMLSRGVQGYWVCAQKMIDSHIYPSTYDVRVQILLPNHVLVHIRDDNDDIILLPYV